MQNGMNAHCKFRLLIRYARHMLQSNFFEHCLLADLDEFYAMVNFVSPGLLGDAKAFRLLYADSIVKSRDKTSSDDQRRIGQKR